MKFEKYKKDSDYSYTLGSFPTFELVKYMPKQAVCVLIHSKLNKESASDLLSLCKKNNIEIIEDDKTINKLSSKENCFVIGVFKKFAKPLTNSNQVVLVNPSDMGNMGTIMRTMLGFDVKNLILITPCADYFNPKVIRASMGAIFSLNIKEYSDIDEYLAQDNHEKFFFMLNGKNKLGKFSTPKENFALVFGNEATGLDNSLINKGTSVVIEHSNNIDSLNLPISVGMALYEFNK